MKRRNNIDWDETGLLLNLEGENYDIVKSYLYNISMTKEDELSMYKKDYSLISYTAAMTRRVVMLILSGDSELKWIRNTDLKIRKEVLELLNTAIIKKEVKKYIDFVPECKKYLDLIDFDFKIFTLFCHNYVFKLVKKRGYTTKSLY